MNPFSRPLVSGLALLGVIILLGLGTWQVQRLAWKTDLMERVESRIADTPKPLSLALDQVSRGGNVEYLPVVFEAVFLPGHAARIFGTYDGTPGTFLLEPAQFLREDGEYGGIILINRGFVPEGQAAASPPTGVVRMRGLARTFRKVGGMSASLAPPDDLDEGLFYTRRRAPLASYYFDVEDAPFDPADLDQLAPIYVDSALNTGAEDAPRGGTTRIEFSNRHLGYAITWYGLAVGLIGVYLAFMRRAG